MNTDYITLYPESEHNLYSSLINLQDTWKVQLEKNFEQTSQLFVYDGFAPYYTEQKYKILFIGKESLEVANSYYIIDILKNCYNANLLGGKSIDSYKFHAVMNYVAYGINNNFPEYESLPWASEISSDFGEKGGLSFAFMNISKFSNESGQWKADIPLIEKFISLSNNLPSNFFMSEIELLNPDIIIGMNLCKWYQSLGTIVGPIKNFNGCVDYYRLKTLKGEYPLLDSWHFSAPRKKVKEDLYLPLMEAAKFIL